MHIHRGSKINPEIKKVKPLLVEWLSGSKMQWRFPVPTRVCGFEIQEPNGVIKSIRINNEEQLITVHEDGISIVGMAQYHPDGVESYKLLPGWVLGPILLPTISVSDVLSVETEIFTGRMRPFGIQLDE